MKYLPVRNRGRGRRTLPVPAGCLVPALLLLGACGSLLPDYFEVGAREGDFETDARPDYEGLFYSVTVGWDLQPRQVVVMDEGPEIHPWNPTGWGPFWSAPIEPESEPEPEEITIEETSEGTVITIPRAATASVVVAAIGALLYWFKRRNGTSTQE